MLTHSTVVIITLLKSQIFQQLDIRVVLVSTITFTMGDRFTVVPDALSSLNAFTAFVRNIKPEPLFDSTMLIT